MSATNWNHDKFSVSYKNKLPYLKQVKGLLKKILMDVILGLDDRNLVRAGPAKFRIKEPDSLARKAQQRGWGSDQALWLADDLIGARVVCNNIEDVYRFQELLEEKLHISEVKVQDYIWLCCIKIMRTAIPYWSSRLCPQFDLHRIGPSQGSHPIEDSTVGSGFHLLTFQGMRQQVWTKDSLITRHSCFRLTGDNIHTPVSTPSVPSFESCAGSHHEAGAGAYNCRAARSWHCVEAE